ncbi:MAG: LytTR family transcriptional regulator DNA-binding domain-containing protein [Oscillospiraceae bacterium]
MQESKFISVIVNRKKVEIDVRNILYVVMRRKNAEIHVLGGKVYVTRTTYGDILKALDDNFIEVRRGCIVSVMAIHNVTRMVNLSNGESIEYTVRKKKDIVTELRLKQQCMISSFSDVGVPSTYEEYRKYYSGFEHMPFAFTDIEMIFNDESHAVDWIFRYGNEALAKLEKLPLEKLIGSSFGSLFDNMDAKWLKNYERSALFGETLEIIDYSPEINSDLKIISFPTFKGHCGCILFDVRNIKFTRNSGDAEKALMYYFNMVPGNDG